MANNIISAVQHARCVAAIDVLLPFLDPDCWRTQKDRIARLEGWARKCAGDLAQKPLGARAGRLRDRTYSVLVKYIEGGRTDDQMVQDVTTAACLIAAAHLIAEVKITCRAWAHGQAWYQTDRMVYGLARDLIAEYPDAETPGVALYEKLASEWDA